MTLNFLWWWGGAEKAYPSWRDGLRAALEYIAKDHGVIYQMGEQPPQDVGDFTLIWGDSTCPAIDLVRPFKGRKGIILTTWPHDIENLKKLDVVFCESSPIYNEVRRHGLHAVKAFGTDSNFFVADPRARKSIEIFYPATFSPWKRQEIIAPMFKNKLWCVGTLQPDGQEQLAACQRHGVHVEIGYFPVEKIRRYYQKSKRVVIPADHGSERTVLESMACGIVPEVLNIDNRAYSYLQEYRYSECESPREFIEKYYSGEKYGKTLLQYML